MARTRRTSWRANQPARMKRLAAMVLCAVMALAAHADERDSDGVMVITGDAPAGPVAADDSGVVVIGGARAGAPEPIAPGQDPDATPGASEGGPAAADKVADPVPSDEATLVQPDDYLEWAPAAGAVSYVVYLGTDRIPDDDEYAGETADTWYGPTELDYSTTYYWRIDAKNAAGAVTTGDVWYFTTAPPFPCKVRGGIPVPGLKIDVAEDVRLLWTEACHATGYHVYYGTNPTPGVREYRGVVAGTEYGVGALEPDTTYYWRIDAMNEAGETTGDVWSFASHTPLPEPVTEPDPPDEAEGVSVNVVLSWPSSRWAKWYEIEFWEYRIGAPIFSDVTNETRYEVGTLAYDTAYRWRVNAANSAGVTKGYVHKDGYGDDKFPYDFRTEPEPAPGKPTGELPPHGSRGVERRIELSWSAPPHASVYQVYFGTDPEPDRNPWPFNEYRGETEETWYDPGPLDGNTTYYWRIDVTNAAGDLTTGDVWEFTTESQTPDHEGVRPGEWLRDCEWCPELVVVPAGSFEMGTPATAADRYDNEGPVRRVTIAEPFAVGIYEVTRSEFGRFVAATGHDTGNRCRIVDHGWRWTPGMTWRYPGYEQGENEPVVCVNWHDAQAYVRWLSAQTGQAYRLLSEAEWEYVARAGTTSARYWGESDTGQCHHANGADATAKRHHPEWRTAACDDGYYRTAPVGSFAMNPYGLSDVLGNVWERVEDCWNESYARAPSDGSAWETGDCALRVVRGASWDNRPAALRSAFRFKVGIGDRFDAIGFRVARSLGS